MIIKWSSISCVNIPATPGPISIPIKIYPVTFGNFIISTNLPPRSPSKIRAAILKITLLLSVSNKFMFSLVVVDNKFNIYMLSTSLWFRNQVFYKIFFIQSF